METTTTSESPGAPRVSTGWTVSLTYSRSSPCLTSALSEYSLRSETRPRSYSMRKLTGSHLYGELVGRRDIKGKIVDEIDELLISAFQDITSAIIQHETLENHLYEHIDDDGDRSQFAENPIPNRNAAIHGLVPYSTEKTSLNSIFLADSVLQMITERKREKIAEIADILRGRVLGAKSA